MFFFFAEVAHHQPGLIDVLFDFRSNVINWLVLFGLVLYGWNKLVPNMMAQRAKSIEGALAAAENTRQEAQEFLAGQKSRIENAQKESDKILDEAKTVAEQLKVEIEAQTKREVSDLERKFEAALDNERQMVITEVREAAVKAAIQLSKTYLEQNVSEEDNKRLLSQFMQELDSLSDGQSFAPGTAVGVSGRSEK